MIDIKIENNNIILNYLQFKNKFESDTASEKFRFSDTNYDYKICVSLEKKMKKVEKTEDKKGILI